MYTDKGISVRIFLYWKMTKVGSNYLEGVAWFPAPPLFTAHLAQETQVLACTGLVAVSLGRGARKSGEVSHCFHSIVLVALLVLPLAFRSLQGLHEDGQAGVEWGSGL